MTTGSPYVRVIALVPTRGTVSAELLTALNNNTEGHRVILRTVNRETVDVARNRLAVAAIAAADDPELFAPGTDPYVFWIDSDAFFLHGTLTLMIRTLEANPTIDVLAALFGPRAGRTGAAAFRKEADTSTQLIPDVNFKRGDLVDVELVGLHFVMHRVSLLRKLGANPFGEPDSVSTDDAEFCLRLRRGNGRIAVATGIPVFHIDERNGAAYSPGISACVIDGDTIDTTRLAEELPFESREYGDRVNPAVRDPERRLKF